MAFVATFLLTLVAAGPSCAQQNEGEAPIYAERYRPQFHFTAAAGWLNDPNGLVYHDGEYHLFFQHTKETSRPLNRTRWGHAVSTDLVHWKQLDDAILPDGDHPAFSGSAVVDHNNTAGFQTGDMPAIVAVYTSWGQGQFLSYSNDRGRTWTRYDGNPVLELPGDELRSWPLSARDPHVMWDEQRERWVMVLYCNPEQRPDRQGSGFSIFTSPDLKQWEKRSHLAGFYVCPDVFQLPIEGEPGQRRWVAMDWEKYTTGEFDGATFTPDAETRKLDFGRSLSANQSWKHLPDGRVIQICWLRYGQYPGMPFNQQLSFPTVLSLRRIDDRLFLCKNPIREIRTLHRDSRTLGSLVLAEGESREFKDLSQSLDIEASFTLGGDAQVVFSVLNQEIRITRSQVQSAGYSGSLPGEPEEQDVRILADRTSIEVFVNGGSLTMAFCLVPENSAGSVTVEAAKGKASFQSFSIRNVASIWQAGILGRNPGVGAPFVMSH